MSTTYAGTSLTLIDALPLANDRAGFEALSFVSGACALWDVPPLYREWDKVSEDLVCGSGATFERKGGYTWAPATFKLSRLPGDQAQAIFESLESSNNTGSFCLNLSGAAGTVYFTAKVSKFAIADGGTKNAIHTSSVELIIQSDPVFVRAGYELFTVDTILVTSDNNQMTTDMTEVAV